MNYLLNRISRDQILQVFNHLHQSIYELKKAHMPDEHLVIHCPHFLINTLKKKMQSIQFDNENSKHKASLFRGIALEQGYDQNNIFVSNAKGAYMPDQTLCYKITYLTGDVFCALVAF